MFMQYEVTISELLQHKVIVTADNAEEARKKVQDQYFDSDIVLTADNYVDGSVQFDVRMCD